MSNILRQQIERIVSLTDEDYAFVLSHFSSKKIKKHRLLILLPAPAMSNN
jgi:hypothetical protein